MSQVDVPAEMRGRALAAVAGTLYGLGESSAANAGLAEVLASEDTDLQAHLYVALVQLTVDAVQGWANASGHDVTVLLDVLAPR